MSAPAIEASVAPAAPVRSRRVLWGLVWNVGSHALNVANQIVTVPLFIREWGNVPYGDWLSLSALVAYLALADGGMQNYVVTLLTQRAVKGRWDELSRELASATAMYVGAFTLAVAVALGLGVALPFHRWFEGRPMAAMAPLVLTLLGLQAAAALANGFLGGIYRVLARNDLWLAAGFLYRTAALLATVVVLLAGGGVRMLAVAQAAVGLGTMLVLVVDVSRRDPRLRPRLRGATKAIAFGFLAPSLLFLLLALATGLSVQGIVLVLSSTVGALAVVVFSTTRVLANVVRQVVAGLTQVVWPELTRLEAGGNLERVAFAHRLLVKLSSVLAVILAAWLFVAGPTLYRLWTGGRTVPDVTLMRLLLADQILATPWFASSALLTATNRHRALSLLFLGASGLTVLACLLVAPRFGVGAVGVVVLVVNAATFGVLVPKWAQEATGGTLAAYARGLYLPLGLFAVASLAAAWLASLVPVSGLARVVLPGAAAALVALASYRRLFTAGERGFLAGGLKAALGRRAREAS